jgi:hypothetical protein
MAAAQIGTSAREQARVLIVRALDELGVPTRTGLLIDYIAARFDTKLDNRAISDVRRAEERRFDRQQGDRGPYVAPAIEAVWYQPITKMLTLVEWPLERRIIGPWSERADHLVLTIRLAQRVSEGHNRPLEALVTKLARTIPEVRDGPFNPLRIIKGGDTELCTIGMRDRSWRTEAAQKAAATLTPTEARWGVTNIAEDDT